MGWTSARTEATLPLTLRERGKSALPMPTWIQIALRSSGRPVLMVVCLGTFLAILGPFGSDDLGWPRVWLYWVGFIALGGIVGFGLGHVLPKLLPQLPDWSVYVIVAATVSVPVTFSVVWVNSGFDSSIEAPAAFRVYLLVLVISGFATSVVYVVDRLTGVRGHESKSVSSETPAQAGRALLDKLPVHLRHASLLSLSSEDHYLRVRTDRGEALILMRLSDAVAACEALDGARTHRSWWVARAAVKDATKGDGRGTLVLSDGTEAPVSRTYYPKLKEAGWF